MAKMLILGRGGAINANRIVAIAHAKSAPVDRMLKAVGPEKVMNLTYGYPRRSAIMLDNGFVVLSSIRLHTLVHALENYKELNDDEETTFVSQVRHSVQ